MGRVQRASVSTGRFAVFWLDFGKKMKEPTRKLTRTSVNARNELDTTLALSSNSYDRIIASSSLQAGSNFANLLVDFK